MDRRGMDMEEAWTLARRVTRLVRQRRHMLYTFGATKLPYLCLTPDPGRDDRVNVHVGTVAADRPRIALPGLDDAHDFEGFWPSDADGMDGIGGPAGPNGEPGLPVWLARTVSMPGGKYVNEREATRSEPGPLDHAVERVERGLENDNDIRTAVLTSDDRVWRLSVLLYIASQVARSAPSNVLEHLEHHAPGGPRRE